MGASAPYRPVGWTYLTDKRVIELVPDAVGPLNEAEVVARVHRVALVHQDAVQLIQLRRSPPVAHVRAQIKVMLKVNLQQHYIMLVSVHQ